MDPENFSLYLERKHNLEYFTQLVRIAMADNIISDKEIVVLHELGKKIDLSDTEIDFLIEQTEKSDYIPAHKLPKRFEKIFDVIKLILADGTISKEEIRLADNYAAKLGFKESEIPGLLNLLILGLKSGKSCEVLLDAFKKSRRMTNSD